MTIPIITKFALGSIDSDGVCRDLIPVPIGSTEEETGEQFYRVRDVEALRKSNYEQLDEINEMSHNCNDFKGEIEALRKQSAERRELLQLCDQGRAGKIHDPLIDQSIFNLCESRGYGAVMDSAQRQWELKDPVGCFTIGPCLGSVRHALKEINK